MLSILFTYGSSFFIIPSSLNTVPKLRTVMCNIVKSGATEGSKSIGDDASDKSAGRAESYTGREIPSGFLLVSVVLDENCLVCSCKNPEEISCDLVPSAFGIS